MVYVHGMNIAAAVWEQECEDYLEYVKTLSCNDRKFADELWNEDMTVQEIRAAVSNKEKFADLFADFAY